MWKIRQWLSLMPPNCIPGKKTSSKKFQLSATHAIRFSNGRGRGGAVMNSVGSKGGRQAKKPSQKRQLTRDPKESVGSYRLHKVEKSIQTEKEYIQWQAGEGLLPPSGCHPKLREGRAPQRVQVQRWPG